MTTVESRLDRIEALLERHIIQSAADRQQAERDRQTFQNNFTAITEQAERDRQQATKDRETTRAVVRELVENAEADRLALVDSITENKEKINTLTQRFDRFVEQAAADRQQAAIDRQTFQNNITEINQRSESDRAEIRRIWEYLSSQNRNGGASQ